MSQAISALMIKQKFASPPLGSDIILGKLLCVNKHKNVYKENILHRRQTLSTFRTCAVQKNAWYIAACIIIKQLIWFSGKLSFQH